MNIKMFVYLFLLLILCSQSFADWVSPIDQKYSGTDPELFKKFDEARTLINNNSGNSPGIIQAYTLLTEIIKENEEFSPAYREYSRFLMRSGMINYSDLQNKALQSAKLTILKSIEIEPEYADAFSLLGFLYSQSGEEHKALVALQKAEEIGTETPWLFLNLAKLYIQMGNIDKALGYYMKATQNKYNDKRTYYNALNGVIDAYNIKRNVAESEKWREKLIEFYPSADNYRKFTIFLRSEKGDFDKAIEIAEKGLDLYDDSDLRFNLSLAYYAKWAQLSELKNSNAEKYLQKGQSISIDYKKVRGQLYSSFKTHKYAVTQMEDLIRKFHQPPYTNYGPPISTDKIKVIHSMEVLSDGGRRYSYKTEKNTAQKK